MSIKKILGFATAAIGVSLALSSAPAHAQYVTLDQSGTVTLDNSGVNPTLGSALDTETGTFSGVGGGPSGTITSSVYGSSGSYVFVYTVDETSLGSVDELGWNQLNLYSSATAGFYAPSYQVGWDNNSSLTNDGNSGNDPPSDSLIDGVLQFNFANMDTGDLTFVVDSTATSLTNTGQAGIQDGSTKGALPIWLPGTPNFSPPPTPEPASFAAFGMTGFAILALALTRRIKRPTISAGLA